MLLPSALGFSPHQPVSVYGTGTYYTIAAFLGTRHARFPTMLRSASRRPRRLRAAFPSAPVLRACVPAVLSRPSAGISTCCPSATPPGLALGPDSPREDQLYPGNLGYSAARIPTSLSLLIPAFSLREPPRALSVTLRRLPDAPLPIHLIVNPRASAACLSPGHFRRGASRPVSYYALFERMAASEPTSWLS